MEHLTWVLQMNIHKIDSQLVNRASITAEFTPHYFIIPPQTKQNSAGFDQVYSH